MHTQLARAISALHATRRAPAAASHARVPMHARRYVIALRPYTSLAAACAEAGLSLAEVGVLALALVTQQGGYDDSLSSIVAAIVVWAVVGGARAGQWGASACVRGRRGVPLRLGGGWPVCCGAACALCGKAKAEACNCTATAAASGA